jgi:hypothetical protein
MCGGGGDGGAAERARQQEEQRQARIRQGMAGIDSALKPFNDSYFNNKATNYTGYYMPQLGQQYDDALSALKLQLSSSGLGGSSAGAFGLARLAKEFADRKAEIQGKASEYANQARGNIQDLRSSLVSQLNATSDPQAAIQAANNQAYIQQNRPDSFSPLTSAFSNLAGLFKYDTDKAINSGGVYQGMFGTVKPTSGNSGRTVVS